MSVILYTCGTHYTISSSCGLCIECEEELAPVEYVPKSELDDLQNRFEGMSECYGSAVLEIEKLKALLVDLDKINRTALAEGQGAWSLSGIYQPRIDEAIGVLPFDTPSAEDVSEDEVRGKYE